MINNDWDRDKIYLIKMVSQSNPYCLIFQKSVLVILLCVKGNQSSAQIFITLFLRKIKLKVPILIHIFRRCTNNCERNRLLFWSVTYKSVTTAKKFHLNQSCLGKIHNFQYCCDMKVFY